MISRQALFFLMKVLEFILLKYVKLPNIVLRTLEVTSFDKGQNLAQSQTEKVYIP